MGIGSAVKRSEVMIFGEMCVPSSIYSCVCTCVQVLFSTSSYHHLFLFVISLITPFTFSNIIFLCFILVCVFCFLFCVFCIYLIFFPSFCIYSCLFPIFVQVYRPLPTVGNQIVVNKYYIIKQWVIHIIVNHGLLTRVSFINS